MGNSFKLRNGSILLSTEAPGGIYNASQLKKIAALCDGDAVVVKATEDQRLALLVKPNMAASVAEELKSIGLGIRHYQDGLHQPVSCVGEMCEDHEQDALGSALDISAEIDGLVLNSPLKIGINGCAKCCVPCHTLDVSIVGDSSGYRISLGGKNSQLPEMASFVAEGVPPAEMPKLIRSIIDIYKAGAHENETLQEFIEREGSRKFVEALAPWSQDAAETEDPFASSAESDPIVAPRTPDSSQLTEYAVSSEITEVDESLDLTMDNSPLDTDRLNQEHNFSLAAGADSDLTNELLEIPVEPRNGDASVTIPIDPPFESDVPEISMHDIVDEDLSQAAADLMNSPTEKEVGLKETESLSYDGEINDDDLGAVKDADLSEVKIDAGDALRSHSTSDNDVAEVNVDDLSEDAIEAELAAGIDAQRDLIGANDPNDAFEAARDQGVDLLEAASPSLLDEGSQMTGGEGALDPETYKEPALVHHDESDEEDFDVHDHLPLSEVVATRKISPEIVKRPIKSPNQSWSISGFDLDDRGSPVISWSNGAIITITSEAVAHGVIRVGGHEIFVSEKDGGLQVEVDGLRMYLPTAA